MKEPTMPYKDFHSIMHDNARRFGSKDYIVSVDQQKKITFEEMNAYCNRVANFLRSKEIQKNSKISLIGKNTIETLIIFYAVMKYGAIINPINAEESRSTINNLLKRVKPSIVLYDHEFDFDHEMASALWLPFSHFDDKGSRKGELFSLIKDYDSDFETPLGDSDDMAEILFTSGTTETPKGVVISRERLYYMVAEVIDRLKITAKDRILEYRAYSWASPQLLTILSSMVTGATLVLAKKFSRSKFALWLKQNDVTISSGVPTVFNMLISDPIKLHQNEVPSLKYITSSSAPLSVKQHQAFERIYGISINQMAGMTEAGWMMGNPPEKRKMGSVGTPLKYKDINIVNELGQPCQVGEVGEIVVRGQAMGLGYLNDRGGIDPFPEQGFPTGDLGYRDSQGYIYISGRKKDLIIRGGVNISPKEITDHLMAYPGVKEAVTLGFPDKIYGEEVTAFVVPEPGCPMTQEEIVNHCRDKLPDFKVPKFIKFLEHIPRTKTGKVSKPALLKMIHAGQAN